MTILRTSSFLFIMLFCISCVLAAPIPTDLTVIYPSPGDDASSGVAAVIEWGYTADTTLGTWEFIYDDFSPLPFGVIDTIVFDITFPDEGRYWIAANAIDDAGNESGMCIIGSIDLLDIDAPGCVVAINVAVTRK